MTEPRTLRAGRSHSPALAAALLTAVLLLDPIHAFPERLAFLAPMAAAEKTPPAGPDRTVPPARDPEVAVREEYEMARQKGTAQALELFVARHPTGPLADKARADLQRLGR